LMLLPTIITAALLRTLPRHHCQDTRFQNLLVRSCHCYPLCPQPFSSTRCRGATSGSRLRPQRRRTAFDNKKRRPQRLSAAALYRKAGPLTLRTGMRMCVMTTTSHLLVVRARGPAPIPVRVVERGVGLRAGPARPRVEVILGLLGTAGAGQLGVVPSKHTRKVIHVHVLLPRRRSRRIPTWSIVASCCAKFREPGHTPTHAHVSDHTPPTTTPHERAPADGHPVSVILTFHSCPGKRRSTASYCLRMFSTGKHTGVHATSRHTPRGPTSPWHAAGGAHTPSMGRGHGGGPPTWLVEHLPSLPVVVRGREVGVAADCMVVESTGGGHDHVHGAHPGGLLPDKASRRWGYVAMWL
jgi:hypothetical protein